MTYIIIGSVIFLIAIVFGNKGTQSFSAKFGRAFNHTSIFNLGYSLTGGLGATTRDMAYKNILLVAQTGAGKTSCVAVPSIFNLSRGNNSMAILDVAGELFRLTSGWLAKKGYKIYCIDLTETSDGFNIFLFFKNVDDVDKAADIIMINGEVGSSSEKYWLSAGQMLLSTMMQFTFLYAEPQYKNMANVVHLIETFAAEPEKIDLLFIKAKDERLLKSYQVLNKIPDRTLQSVISTTLAALKIFKSPSVARCTSMSTINLADLRSERSVLYLSIPLTQINFLAPVTALIFSFLFQELLSKIPDPKQMSCYLILDEMMSMKIKDLGMLFSQCRKYSVSCLAIVQHEKMLELKYSIAESHTIKNNCYTKIYLQGQAHDTCLQLQEILGKTVTVDEKGIEHRKYLMEAAAIRMSKDAIIILGAELPLKERMTPYYKHFIFNGRTKIRPYELQRKIPFDEPPFISLD